MCDTRTYDLTEERKRGGSLSAEETAYTVCEFVAGDILDYQMSTMLTVVYSRDMDDREITDLTLETAYSEDTVGLPPIEGVKVDKHSTGGMGDKTTLVTGPIVTACGVKVAKMSGRGLRHTGGAVDKLENIPGFKTAIPREEFFRIINENDLAPTGQLGNIVPVDKKLYALWDATATVDNISLIASSIMSKKLTTDSDCIILDVKAGSGAFMKSLEGPTSLAREMAPIGILAGRCCCALVTNMDVPPGHAIGNSLKMEEATETLKGRGPEDSTCVPLELAANILHTVGKEDMEQCRKLAKGAIEDKSALQCLRSTVESQGGDGHYAKHPDLLARVPLSREVKTPEAGCITRMDIEGTGVASAMLGVDRDKKEGTIDYSAGILLRKKYGDRVETGEIMAIPYVSHEDLLGLAAEKFLTSYILGKQKLEPGLLAFTRISDVGVERGTIEEKIP